MRRHRPLLPFLCALPLAAAGPDPTAGTILAVAIIYVTALLFGEVAIRLGQPGVLGELIGGLVLGNLHLVGVGVFEFIKTDVGVDLLARFGVLLLLFEVGVEATVRQMLQVGARAVAVAVAGVVAPFGLGWLVGMALLPDGGAYQWAFLGATLCATSVGITARVLKDIGRSASQEARIILGAAVVDDVLGLIILAVVSGIIVAANAGTAMGVGAVAGIVVKSAVFLVGAIVIGVWLAPRSVAWSARLRGKGAALAVSLALCFGTAWAAWAAGLAPIIGAFAAGLVLESAHYRPFTERGEHPIEDLLHPLLGMLVPVFFVLMGMRTDLAAFVQPGVPLLALGLCLAAFVGKLACAPLAGRGVDGLAVGLGMVPRGEVGLIFANIGLGLTIAGEPVVGAATYSALVVMVIVTTMVTPPALKWRMTRAP